MNTNQHHKIVSILDNVRSALNVGSFFRTCDGLGIDKLYLCGITATPPHKQIHKTALGATQTVAWESNEDSLELIRQLREEGFLIYAIEVADDALNLQDVEFPKDQHIAFVFGNEVDGVSNEILNECDGCIVIPMLGIKISYNVSVSGSMVLWEAVKQLRLS